MNNQWAGTTFYYPENPDPSLISGEVWKAAEEKADLIISLLQPTVEAEERRRSIAQFVQKLIRSCFQCQIYPYGSVPLRTYLPHGDIDMTVFCETNDVRSLALAVQSRLQEQELKYNSEYPVQRIKFIDAEVKLVKCMVDNIVVDISFNQLGGLCALSFFEQLDRAIGQNHLLKRSIILIKSWFFYESHILGGYHGLFSTYALEMLVLHVLNRFNLFVNGPLEVLYRFVDYFGNFDWERYCVSLEGQALRSSLPEVIVKKPENGGTEFLMSQEFLRNCVEVFSIPANPNAETKPRRPFQRVLNIIDPLKENNNLGRSISNGNFHRICHAFRFCARQLNRAFKLPPEEVGHQIEEIFCNTLRKNIPQPFPIFHFDAITVPQSCKMSSGDQEFLEMLKNCSDEVDFEEFKDLLTLQRTEKDEDEIMKTFSARRTSLSGEYGYELLNLTGDLDTHLRNLLYGQWSAGVTTAFNVPMRHHVPSEWRGHMPSQWRGHVLSEWREPQPSVWREPQPSEWGRRSDEPPKQRCVKSTGSSSSSSESSPRRRGLNPNAESWTGSQCGLVGPTAYMASSSPFPVSFGSDQIPRYRGTGTFIPNQSNFYMRTAMSMVPPMFSIPSTTGIFTGPELLYSEQQQCATANNNGIAEGNEYELKNKEEFPASK